MEQQATWILSKTGQEISGCCIQAATRDFARFGQFILDGASVNGQAIVPEGWLDEATTERTGIDQPGRGYVYFWWTYSDGSFAARGIFGQGIFIDPKRRHVIASNANWAAARATVADPAPGLLPRGAGHRRRSAALIVAACCRCGAALCARHSRPFEIAVRHGQDGHRCRGDGRIDSYMIFVKRVSLDTRPSDF
jgi:hypothetical protein